METRRLGRTEVSISEVALGCVTFGREIDEETSHEVMDYAYESGITFFDTAESYGGGQSRQTRRDRHGVHDAREVSGEWSSSERIIGDWMRSRGVRDEITICTKVSTGASPGNIARALDTSLDRLKTDRVDIYKIHSPDADTPIGDSLQALTSAVAAGKIGVIGCSNFSGQQLGEALAASAANGYARFEVTQPPYNLVQREAERDLYPLCVAQDISVTPYSPLGAGFLAGKYTRDTSDIPQGTRFDIAPSHADLYFSEANFRIVDRLRKASEELGVPMVRLAVAWAMTHPAVTSVIIGARSPAHVDNALEAYRMGLDRNLRRTMSSWSSEV